MKRGIQHIAATIGIVAKAARNQRGGMDARYGPSEWEYRAAVSNYDREYFPGFGNQILVGAEDVNGEGLVHFVFTDEEEGDTVVFNMSHRQATNFAFFIATMAVKARLVQERERRGG